MLIKSVGKRAGLSGPAELLKKGGKRVVCSMAVMGLGQLVSRQWAKGLLYLGVEALFLAYFILRGAGDIWGFFTLGSVRANPWWGTRGDNSVTMLIMGILAVILLGFYFALYLANVRDAYRTQCRVEAGKPPLTFRQELSALFDAKFYRTVLFLPVLGVCVFNVLPIVFMILIAFTNYGGDIVPPRLVDWIGFGNFAKVFTLGQFAPTFGKILSWNLLWAVMSTFVNYFGGLGLALLLNKKCVRGKAFWRLFPVLAYAVPGFITLLAFKFMFSYGGPINQLIQGGGVRPLAFWIWTPSGLRALSGWGSTPGSAYPPPCCWPPASSPT